MRSSTGDSKRSRRAMKIIYFADTDTVLIEFSEAAVEETKEISEDVYLDLDAQGALVSMTVEHAKDRANISEVSFLQMDKAVA
jgi:uncharacterized protein YuzE